MYTRPPKYYTFVYNHSQRQTVQTITHAHLSHVEVALLVSLCDASAAGYSLQFVVVRVERVRQVKDGSAVAAVHHHGEGDARIQRHHEL